MHSDSWAGPSAHTGPEQSRAWEEAGPPWEASVSPLCNENIKQDVQVPSWL